MIQKRKRIWIDRFQTQLVIRIACYFLIYQAAVWFLVFLDRNIEQGVANLLGNDAASIVFLAMTGAVVFLGLYAIYEAIVFSHRVVGPIYRFRKTVQAITAGEEVDLVMLRKNDFLGELRDDFNDMLRALEQRGAVTLKPAEASKQEQQAVAV